MKRYFFTFCMIYLCIIRIEASTIGNDAFFNGAKMMDVMPCDSEIEYSNRTTNCTNVPMRGYMYAPLFIPNETDNKMKVRINLIFIQKNDGTGNFQEDNQEHQSIFDDAMALLNQRASSLVLPDSDCFLGTDNEMIHDIRIQFVDHRYYIKNSAIWNNQLNENKGYHLCPKRPDWFLKNTTDSIHNTLVDTLKGINVFFTEDSILYHHYWETSEIDTTFFPSDSTTKSACSLWPKYANWNASSSIHMPCLYSKFFRMKYIVPLLEKYQYPLWNPTVREWFIDGIAIFLLHELGHSFYLYHPKAEHNSSSSFYPTNTTDTCRASIMNPSGIDGGTHDFLPPGEIGRMYVTAMTTNIQQFIPKETYLGTKTVHTSTTFPRMRMYYSLIIDTSCNLDIPCDMIFSPQCKITIKNGGVLNIDGGSLQSIDGIWGGIEVQNGGKLILSNTTISDYNIVVKSGGSIIIKDNLTINGDHSIQINDGGYLCIDSNASINLHDEFSIIVVSPNAILGCPSCNETCISSRSDFENGGNGQFITYDGTCYLQNVTIQSNYLATGNIVRAGSNVIPTQAVGNVVVNNGGELRIRANETILTNGVLVKQGSKLYIGK